LGVDWPAKRVLGAQCPPVIALKSAFRSSNKPQKMASSLGNDQDARIRPSLSCAVAGREQAWDVPIRHAGTEALIALTCTQNG
jgi:hypothetical protein